MTRVLSAAALAFLVSSAVASGQEIKITSTSVEKGVVTVKASWKDTQNFKLQVSKSSPISWQDMGTITEIKFSDKTLTAEVSLKPGKWKVRVYGTDDLAKPVYSNVVDVEVPGGVCCPPCCPPPCCPPEESEAVLATADGGVRGRYTLQSVSRSRPTQWGQRLRA